MLITSLQPSFQGTVHKTVSHPIKNQYRYAHGLYSLKSLEKKPDSSPEEDLTLLQNLKKYLATPCVKKFFTKDHAICLEGDVIVKFLNHCNSLWIRESETVDDKKQVTFKETIISEADSLSAQKVNNAQTPETSFIQGIKDELEVRTCVNQFMKDLITLTQSEQSIGIKDIQEIANKYIKERPITFFDINESTEPETMGFRPTALVTNNASGQNDFIPTELNIYFDAEKLLKSPRDKAEAIDAICHEFTHALLTFDHEHKDFYKKLKKAYGDLSWIPLKTFNDSYINFEHNYLHPIADENCRLIEKYTKIKLEFGFVAK